MNKFCLTILCTLFCISSYGQERDYVKEMEDRDLQFRQMPNTERLLANYLNGVGIKEDTVYAILFRPSACRRCEMAIPNFYSMFKKYDATKKMLLITAFEDSVASADYLKKNAYVADYYLYDTRDEYKNIFSFNSGDMYGLYILKVCPKQGVMLTGGNPPMLCPEFVQQLDRYTDRLAPHSYARSQAQQDMKLNIPVPSVPKLGKYEDLYLDTKGALNISSVYGVPQYLNGNFLYTDLLDETAILFGKQDHKLVFKKKIEAIAAEKRKFVSVSDEVFDREVKYGNVFYIPLQARFTDTDMVALSYSLPKMFMEPHEKYGQAIAYYNAPALIMCGVNDEKRRFFPLDFDLEHSQYFNMHFDFDIFAQRMWVGCMKLTWPMDGYTEQDYGNDVNLNPFDDRFYSTFNPIVSAFSLNTGKIVGQYGRLEESQRVSKTGYFFMNSVFAHDGSEMLYANGYTGKLYVSDSSRIGQGEKVYTAFEIDTKSIPMPDSSKFHQYEYGTLYDNVFYRCVTEAKMDARYIYCLVKYAKPKSAPTNEDVYTYVVINRKNNKRKEYLLPTDGTDRILAYGIGKEDKKMFPLLLMKKGQQFFMRRVRVR